MRAAKARSKIRGMIMKLTTLLAIVSLGLAGTACSETKTDDGAAPVVEAETVTVEDEYAGTLNLNLGSAEETSSGGFNLNLGGAEENDGLIIGADSYGGGNFGDVPALAIDLPEDEAENASLDVPDEDDIIRLDPK